MRRTMTLLGALTALTALLALPTCGPSESSAQAPRNSAGSPARSQPLPADRAAFGQTPIDADGDAAVETDTHELLPPAEVFQAILSALRAGDVDAALDHVLTPSDAQRQARVATDLAKLAELLESGAVEITTDETRTQGDWAVVVSLIAQPANETVTRRDQFLLRRGNDWKLAPEAVRGDPAVRPLIDDDFKTLFAWFRGEA